MPGGAKVLVADGHVANAAEGHDHRGLECGAVHAESPFAQAPAAKVSFAFTRAADRAVAPEVVGEPEVHGRLRVEVHVCGVGPTLVQIFVFRPWSLGHTELSQAILAPALDASVVEQRAGGASEHAGLDDVREALHAGRWQGVVAVPSAGQLAA